MHAKNVFYSSLGGEGNALYPVLSSLNFYPRDAMLARVFAIATCLSVCPSAAHRYCA